MNQIKVQPSTKTYRLRGILLDEKDIQHRVSELGMQIAKDYAYKELVLIGILKGSFMFTTDLARAIYAAQHQLGLPENQVICDFLSVQSYGDQTYTTGVVRITEDLNRPIEGKHVLLVEDIVDTGLTMSYLLENLNTRKPASVRLCSLLHKPSRTLKKIPIDYLGFTIEDHFVVGYGMDYRQCYRNLPHIALLEPVGEK